MLMSQKSLSLNSLKRIKIKLESLQNGSQLYHLRRSVIPTREGGVGVADFLFSNIKRRAVLFSKK